MYTPSKVKRSLDDCGVARAVENTKAALSSRVKQRMKRFRRHVHGIGAHSSKTRGR